jgi:hypothetical protein
MGLNVEWMWERAAYNWIAFESENSEFNASLCSFHPGQAVFFLCLHLEFAAVSAIS